MAIQFVPKKHGTFSGYLENSAQNWRARQQWWIPWDLNLKMVIYWDLDMRLSQQQ